MTYWCLIGQMLAHAQKAGSALQAQKKNAEVSIGGTRCGSRARAPSGAGSVLGLTGLHRRWRHPSLRVWGCKCSLSILDTTPAQIDL